MSYLLAKEGCYVIGVDKAIEGNDEKSYKKRGERSEYWKLLKSQGLKNLKLVEGNIGELYKDSKFAKVDAVYCSWMPSIKNWSLLFYNEMNAPMIIHVIGETKKPDVNNNEYEDEENKTATGFVLTGPQNKRQFETFGSPYQISRYRGYEVLDVWNVPDFRTVEKSSQKLSKIRIDVKKT